MAENPLETISKTILSMKRRILQVIERGGGKCDYLEWWERDGWVLDVSDVDEIVK